MKYCIQNIYIGSHFCPRYGGESLWNKLHRSPLVVILNTTLCSLNVNNRVVCTTASDNGQQQKPMLTFGNAPYHLQRDQFVTVRLSIFTALLGEQWTGVTPSLVRAWIIFYKVLLAVFRLGKQWKSITIVSSSASCLYSNEFSSALTKHLLLYPYHLSVCMSLHS